VNHSHEALRIDPGGHVSPVSEGALVSVGDKQRLWVETRGGGRPLVLLADIGFDRRVWQPVADRMAADVAVTTVDPPG
jgi:hypothetical protein